MRSERKFKLVGLFLDKRLSSLGFLEQKNIIGFSERFENLIRPIRIN